MKLADKWKKRDVKQAHIPQNSPQQGTLQAKRDSYIVLDEIERLIEELRGNLKSKEEM